LRNILPSRLIVFGNVYILKEQGVNESVDRLIQIRTVSRGGLL